MGKINKKNLRLIQPTQYFMGRLGCRSQGFTLVELLVVLVIVAIFTAIAIPSYQEYARRADVSLVQQEMQKIAEQLERHKAKNFTYRGFDPSFIYDVNGSMDYITLPRGVTGAAIKYTLTIYDGEGSTRLLTDATTPPVIRARSWVMLAKTNDVRNYDLLMTSSGLKCKNKTKVNIKFNTTTKSWECGVGGESW
ncbi:type IV pilin protein [Acinetobacter proteolyticus]|uniref:type IV pilin protein n=1 Tax=Acinetobacter proteolyticus TaxID=1776741 RepID=UPI0031DAE903